MCYSGKCKFEGYMGDCAFPSHIPSIKSKFGNSWCDPSMYGDDYSNYKNELKEIQRLMDEYKCLQNLKEDRNKKRLRLRQKLQKIKQ